MYTEGAAKKLKQKKFYICICSLKLFPIFCFQCKCLWSFSKLKLVYLVDWNSGRASFSYWHNVENVIYENTVWNALCLRRYGELIRKFWFIGVLSNRYNNPSDEVGSAWPTPTCWWTDWVNFLIFSIFPSSLSHIFLTAGFAVDKLYVYILHIMYVTYTNLYDVYFGRNN